jgi:hypothetical protein
VSAAPRINGKGHVTAALCPNSCSTNGLAKNVCRDWREGNVCYVEDLTRPPGYTNLVTSNPVYPGASHYPNFPNNGNGSVSSCNGAYVPRPNIDIHSIKKTGNLFKSYYKVRGTVEGKCITEAGYFEDGRRETIIPTVVTPDFRRFEFEVKIRADRDPEIRAYNTQGERDVYEIEDSDRRDDWDDDRYDHRDDYYDDYDRYDDDYGYHHRRR